MQSQRNKDQQPTQTLRPTCIIAGQPHNCRPTALDNEWERVLVPSGTCWLQTTRYNQATAGGMTLRTHTKAFRNPSAPANYGV